MKKFTKNIFESLSEPCYGLLVVLAGNRCKEDILPPSELPAALKKLLNNNGNLELLSLKHRELSVLNKSPTTGHIVYKAPFVMKLSGTFPNILNYLKKIEQLLGLV